MYKKFYMSKLNEIRDDLIAWISSNVSGLAEVKEYEGELESDGEWVPGLPCCLIEMTGMVPIARDSANKTMKHAIGFRTYVAGKFQDTYDVLIYVDDVMTALEDLVLAYTGQRFEAYFQEMRYAGKDTTVKVYELEYLLQ